VKIPSLIDRLSLFARLLLPDRSLKFFPPDFTLRRPVLSLLNKRIKQGKACYLTLFRLDFSYLQLEIAEEIRTSFAESVRKQLRRISANRIESRRLIALDQYAGSDFILLTEGDYGMECGEFIPPALAEDMENVRRDLESVLAQRWPEWTNSFRMIASTVPVVIGEAFAGNAHRLLEGSYQAALALATGTMTAQMEQLRGQLERLLEKEQITVLAQPIMNLTTGDVYGWEMLTRGPEGSVLRAPDKLFRFASQCSLLSKLEFLVIKRAMEEIASRGIKEPVFLNVTAVTLSHPQFLSHMLHCLERNPPLHPGQVVIEITERHQIVDFDAMTNILSAFRQYGFRFAVDDAGSGYSSLQWIGELEPEMIKIDRSVIRHVDRIAIKESLLRAIVTAAREMKCEIVAEGVEREEEADVLFRLDVGMGQGFYFAKPDVLLFEHEREMFQETKNRIQHRRGLVAS